MNRKTDYNTTVDALDTRDPRTLDWDLRCGRAVIPFDLDEEGRPVNPVQPGLPEGQGELYHHGEAVAGDGACFWRNLFGKRHLLMVERDDDHGWALPGGGLNVGEAAADAVAREVAEETGLKVDVDDFAMLPGRYVDDPRAARGAWMVTVPGVVVIEAETMPVVTGADDARQALWLPADTYDELAAAIAARGGKVFAAHTAMLREVMSVMA